MPRLSCWFIRAALIHLTLGVLLGGLILSGKGLPLLFGWAWLLLAAHIQLLVGGWLIQLALGMAYWIMPRLDGRGDRGRAVAAWVSFAALNAGVVGAALGLVLRPRSSAAWLNGVLMISVVAQALALVAFAWHIWPRLAPIVLPVAADLAPSEAAGDAGLAGTSAGAT